MTNPNGSVKFGSMIPRVLEEQLFSSLTQRKKVHLLFGARQVGKTTLLKQLRARLMEQGKRVAYLNCDLEEDFRQVDTTSLTVLSKLAERIDFLFVDEAQRLDDPGLTLKIFYDNLPGVTVLATGSSSFGLANKTAETLAGRFVDFHLYPFSLSEVQRDSEKWDFVLPDVLIYGSYPEVYLETSASEKRLKLEKIIESYLFVDVLSLGAVRHGQAIRDLTRAIAYQIGSEVNENELANRLKIDRKTVVNYLDVLEKSFVIFRLHPFSKNPRREIGRSYKIYFWDLGVRNGLIGDFNQWQLRSDAGFLWENFLIIERAKRLSLREDFVQVHFWRRYGGAEVDYLELGGRGMVAYEFKMGEGSLGKSAGSFKREYGQNVQLVNQKNYQNFLL